MEYWGKADWQSIKKDIQKGWKEGVAAVKEGSIVAKKKAGEQVTGNLESFTSFVQKKTDQIRKQYGCPSVEYTVEMEHGQVRLKAKAAKAKA